MWADVGRCGQMWGGVGRCGEMWGDASARAGVRLRLRQPRGAKLPHRQQLESRPTAERGDAEGCLGACVAQRGEGAGVVGALHRDGPFVDALDGLEAEVLSLESEVRVVFL